MSPEEPKGAMTEPTRVGEFLPGVLAEVVQRAGHGYERWRSWSLRPATATTPSAWPAASSTPTRQPAKSGGSTLGPGAGRGAAQGLRHLKGVQMSFVCGHLPG